MPTDQTKPKVLLITRNLPPLVGGMERLMHNLAGGLVEHTVLTVIGPKGCSRHVPEGATALEVSAKLAPFLLLSTWLSIKACRSKSYDIIIGGSGLIAPLLCLLSLLYGGRSAIFLHGLDLVVDNFFYQSIFIPCIRKANQVIANSHNTKRIAIDRGVPENRITVINPGTDLPRLPSKESLANFREKYNIRFGKIMIFVGRMTKRKGLSRFIHYSLPSILASEPAAGLIVVGDNPNDSLNKLGEQDAVLEEVQRLENKESVIFLGQVSDGDLINCYAAADVQIFPLIQVSGDIEGFGMIAVEAAACGTPTVAFDLGGVSDAISSKNGTLIEPNQYNELSQAVTDILRTKTPDSNECLEHARDFSWVTYNKKVRDCILN